MIDVTIHKLSGKVCDTSHRNPIIWNGHLCEGANLTAPIGQDFCLWTVCGQEDVPADKAYEGDLAEVICYKCLRHGKD